MFWFGNYIWILNTSGWGASFTWEVCDGEDVGDVGY